MKIGYHIALRWGKLRRYIFGRRVRHLCRNAEAPGPELPFRVVSFSGQRDFLEQAASWISLLRHLGTPMELILVSDGSHHTESLEILKSIHSRVRILDYRDFLHEDLPACVHRYAGQHPLGKKLAVYCGAAQFAPFVFADSDILFFPGASHFRNLVAQGASLLYLPDCAPSYDQRLLREDSEKNNPVNSGFLYARNGFSFNLGLARFTAPDDPVSFFSEQTIVHLAVHQAMGEALPPDRYIMQANDQFAADDHYVKPDTAIRHYISSIRTKMWRQVPLS